MNDTKNEREELTYVVLHNPYEEKGDHFERYNGSYYTRHEKKGLVQKIGKAVGIGIYFGWAGLAIASYTTENKTVDDLFSVFTVGLNFGIAYEIGKGRGEARYKEVCRAESLERELLKLK